MRWLTQMSGQVVHAIKAAIVERSYFDKASNTIQATGIDDDDIADDALVYEPVGVAFRAPVETRALLVHEMADETKPSVAGFDMRGSRPTTDPAGGDVPEGCGGLHYLGAWRVYVDDAGRTYLGGAADTSEPALLGGTFVTLYDAHVHSSPFGPTGAPAVSAASAKSTKIFLV